MTAALHTYSKPYWFIVANESSAIIYAAKARRGDLRVQCVLENDAARAKRTELLADRGGRSFDSHGPGRHTLRNEKMGPKRHASVLFAKAIVQRLAAAKKQGQCREFALIAAPRFLGVLRHELLPARVADPFLSIDKDVVDKPVSAVRELVAENLP